MRNLVEVSVFSDPVSVMENGDALIAENLDPTHQALANRTRHLYDQTTALEPRVSTLEGYNADARLSDLEGRVSGDEWVYPAAKPRSILIPASRFIPNAFSADTNYDFNPAPSGGEVRLKMGSGAFAVANLAGLVPTGANSVKFALIITAGGHLADGKFYQVTKVMSATPSIGSRAVQTLGTVTTAGLQKVEHPSLSTDGWSNSGFTGELVYSAGTLDVGSYDYIEGAIATFTDPGPRNF